MTHSTSDDSLSTWILTNILWTLYSIIHFTFKLSFWVLKKIPKIIYIGLLIPYALLYAYESSIVLNPAVEDKGIIVYDEPTPTEQRLKELGGTTWSRASIDWYISVSAEEYGADEELIHALIKCESNYVQDVRAKAILSYGQEDSWGLSQIHLPSHPTVTRENAIDPEYAIDFMSKHVSEGRQWMWMCSELI